MSTKIAIVAQFFPKPEVEDEVVEILMWMAEKSRMEPGCARYDLYRSARDRTSLVLVEEYINQEAVVTHRESTHYREYRKRIQEHLRDPIDVLELDPVKIGGT